MSLNKKRPCLKAPNNLFVCGSHSSKKSLKSDNKSDTSKWITYKDILALGESQIVPRQERYRLHQKELVSLGAKPLRPKVLTPKQIALGKFEESEKRKELIEEAREAGMQNPFKNEKKSRARSLKYRINAIKEMDRRGIRNTVGDGSKSIGFNIGKYDGILRLSKSDIEKVNSGA